MVDNNLIVLPFDKKNKILGYSENGEYLINYLDAIGARSYIKEENYIDKDYLIDYSKFYSRSFEDISKFTVRFHFFSVAFNDEIFERIIVTRNEWQISALNNAYLGYVVIKPIKTLLNHPLIGKTLLKTYPPSDRGDFRKYLKQKYHVSLYGIPLEIESLPFQMQDPAVGACSTIACWIALARLNKLFDIPLIAPYEVTERSVNFPSESRNFPSEGLTLQQIKTFFNGIGLDTEFIGPSSIADFPLYDEESDDIVKDIIIAYLDLGIPIIAGLQLVYDTENVESPTENMAGERETKGRRWRRRRGRRIRGNRYNPPQTENEPSDYHTAVITGYRHNNVKISEIYIHDDNIGPFSKTTPGDPQTGFITWNNEWLNPERTSVKIREMRVNRLIVPLYPKIRLPFSVIYQKFLQLKALSKMNVDEGPGQTHPEETFLVFLTENRLYKNFLFFMKFENKMTILSKPMPRFLWVIRALSKGYPVYDYVYDGTSVHLRPLEEITFETDVIQRRLSDFIDP